MRVCVQIPHFNTGLEDSTIRAAQAITYEPDELYAYRTLSQNKTVSNFTPKLLGYDLSKQDSAGLVREGFHLSNMPLGYFLIETHRAAPTESAATLASLFKSNLTSRFGNFSASSTMTCPRVNLKNSSLEFQSESDQ